jgi:hypothetical protein
VPIHFVDPVFLHRTGATSFSADLAALLVFLPAVAPMSPRWFALPDDRDRALDGEPPRLTIGDRNGRRD